MINQGKDENTDAVVRRLRAVQRVRQGLVVVGIGLVVWSFLKAPTPAVVYARVAIWSACGVTSLVEGLMLGKARQAAGNAYFNALIFFAIAFIPYFRGRM